MVVLCAFVGLPVASATTYYFDADTGSDTNTGTAPDDAWRSLGNIRDVSLEPGDRILLRRGSRFEGSLVIEASGTAEGPVIVGAYGSGPRPLIDADGHLAGVHLRNAAHVEVRDLRITGDGGPMVDGSPERERFGVLISAEGEGSFAHITVRDLHIHDIFPGVGSSHEGRRPTTHLGYGVVIRGTDEGDSGHVLVEGCRIERVGFKAIEVQRVRHIEVVDNWMREIGGPAIQPSRVEDMVVRGNYVHGSGAFTDARMHGRGSGIWPWTSERILIERNTFIGARGKADSCGIHIDYNCRDVIVQYNLSIDNEGGFIEILGNNHNCAYRYNISINDGSRVRRRDGAHQEGKILWTSGYVGRDRQRVGPYNSYIYNNTIFVGPESRSCFGIGATTDGLLVVNNIFHILGRTENVAGDQGRLDEAVARNIPRGVVRNNLVIREDLFPADLPFGIADQIVGDADFRHPGGLNPLDYLPRNTGLVAGQGIPVEKLPGDKRGLMPGLAVEYDFLGNRIVGAPDLGAIQVSPPVKSPTKAID